MMERVSEETVWVTCKLCKKVYSASDFKEMLYKCPCNPKEPFGFARLSEYFTTHVEVKTRVDVPNSYIQPSSLEESAMPYKCKLCENVGELWSFNEMGVCATCMDIQR